MLNIKYIDILSMLRNRSKKIRNRKNKTKKSFKKKSSQFGGWNDNLSKLYKNKPLKNKTDKWNKQNIISQYTGFQSGGGWGDNINNIKFNQFAGGILDKDFFNIQEWGLNVNSLSKQQWSKNLDINNSQSGGWGESPQTVNLDLINGQNLYKNQLGGWQVDLLSINNWNKK